MYHKRLSKNGQISIPKKVEQQLNLIEGEYLYIYQNKESVIIVNTHFNKTLNQCLYKNRRISIPAEIRRFLGISLGTTLEITLADDTAIKIKKAEKQTNSCSSQEI